MARGAIPGVKVLPWPMRPRAKPSGDWPDARMGRFDGGGELRDDPGQRVLSNNNNGGSNDQIDGLAAGIAALIASAPVATAADYPTKPITLMIGFAPGGRAT